MNTPVLNDVFKFLTVRPAQLVTEKETHRTIIRDVSATDPDGAHSLALLARNLARPEAALAHWRELDLSSLAHLAEVYRAVLLHYENLSDDDAPPDALSVLRKAGDVRSFGNPQVLQVAWRALYIADSTGADAGPRLEVPMAALRVLHFAELLDEQPRPSSSEALDALLATPAIPQVFYNARVAVQTAVPAVEMELPPTEVQPEISKRSTQLRALAQELAATERLLGLVNSAPVASTLPIQIGPTVQEGGWLRSEFSLRSEQALRSALSGQLSRDEAALLDRLRISEAYTVPLAAQTLQEHFSKLTNQAFALGQDKEFQSYLRELTMPLTVSVTPIPENHKTDQIGALIGDLVFPKAVNVAGLIKPLGIGDLKVVKQTLLAYVPGEVAHIENVLKGESKERKHRKLDRTETMLFTSQEETKDTERDTQSTDRFELKREAAQTIQEDMSLKAGLTVTASYGPIVATATGDFAYSTSKQDSQKSSSNFARDVVDRSVTKVQTKTKTERTTKMLNEVEEINTHGVINNEPGAEHVVGIYRWVDKHYRAQVYNYGVRLLLEFIIPEPATFYNASQQWRAPQSPSLREPEPFLNLKGKPLTVADINEYDYSGYVSRYNASGVTPPPPPMKYTGNTLVKEGLNDGVTVTIEKTLVIPEGYELYDLSATASILWRGFPKFSVQMGGYYWTILDQGGGGSPNLRTELWNNPDTIRPITGICPLSVATYDVNAFAVNIQAICKITTEWFAVWQLQTYEKIYTAYKALQTEYDQKVTQAEATVSIAIEGRNPTTNRTIEKTELKKLCITMMTGEHYKRFDAMTEAPGNLKAPAEVDVLEALDEGPIIQFFEQAFEWEQMTYLYYPYFWGRRKNWMEVTNHTSPDPLFEQFLTAGAARVVVPVPIAYKSAVEFLLQSKDPDLRKKVWGGGSRPTIDTPLYTSITEEMRNQTDDLEGATPEGTPWEFTLPTTLVWLQGGPELPVFVL